VRRRILIVEDDAGLRRTLGDRLARESYVVSTACDGDDGLALALAERFDVIVLDVMLPGRGGLEVCRALREAKVETPVLMLTARGQIADKVAGLKLGADDYLTKPFEMAELLARLEARPRRAPESPRATPGEHRFGTIRVDLRRAEVERDGATVELSAKEFQLLRYFIEHRGATLSRQELLDEVWGYESTPTTRTVDVHVSSLRRKLEASPHRPQLIVTVHGLGYKFVG
jgi:two-component system alkaline phosphatase synthesis response regulator PhoP